VAWMMYRKHLTAWFAAVVLLSSAALPKPTPHNTTAVSEEPFRSFGVLDSKLTRLTNQQDALKAASSLTESDSGATADQITRRKKASQSMNATAAEIERLAGALERLYERRHQNFGVQMFKLMRIKAAKVQSGVNSMAKAQTRSALDRAAKTLDDRILSLVAQFQAASGGYGAARCEPGAWTCCEPKHSKASAQAKQTACMWVCVPRPRSCMGFTGPRIREQP
jgi:flagellar hook-basal body complex protein FliE